MFRGSDIACRFGGEEFAILLAETPLGAALRRAEAFRLAIHGLHAHHGNTVLEGLTVSIGVTAGSGDAMTPEQLLEEADIALYEAKARGRDCCVAYSGGAGMRPLPFDMPPRHRWRTSVRSRAPSPHARSPSRDRVGHQAASSMLR